jgi:membrane associated rhomboid family serine protease
MSRNAFFRRPVPYAFYNLTIVLLVANVIVYLLMNMFPRIYVYTALIPALVIREGFWWQVLTYMFVHGGTQHIFFNMLGLFIFGARIEQRLGSWEFLLYYLVSGIGAGLFTLFFNYFTGMGMVPVVGASGAIYGLLLAFAVLFPDAVLYIFFILPMRARTAVLVFAALALFSGVTGTRAGVAHFTHLAGLVFGFLYFRIRLGIDPIDSFRR